RGREGLLWYLGHRANVIGASLSANRSTVSPLPGVVALLEASEPFLEAGEAIEQPGQPLDVGTTAEVLPVGPRRDPGHRLSGGDTPQDGRLGRHPHAVAHLEVAGRSRLPPEEHP